MAFWGPASTTTSIEQGYEFAGARPELGLTGDTLLELKIPQGTDVIVYNANESEILIPPGWGIKVEQIDLDVNFNYVHPGDPPGKNREASVMQFVQATLQRPTPKPKAV